MISDCSQSPFPAHHDLSFLTYAVTFLFCWCLPVELAVLIAVPVQKTVRPPYKMSNSSVSDNLTSLERKLGLVVWWHHILGWEKRFYNPCFRSRTMISCVHSFLRKPENTRFQSEDASLCVSLWTDEKPAGLLKVCHTHTFGDSLGASTLFSVHWIWASLYLSSRGHHTSAGMAEPMDYFSSSSTVTVQQQFVQFLILCLHPEDFPCKVPSESRGNQWETHAMKHILYNHRCYVVLLCIIYSICVLPPFKIYWKSIKRKILQFTEKHLLLSVAYW